MSLVCTKGCLYICLPFLKCFCLVLESQAAISTLNTDSRYRQILLQYHIVVSTYILKIETVIWLMFIVISKKIQVQLKLSMMESLIMRYTKCPRLYNWTRSGVYSELYDFIFNVSLTEPERIFHWDAEEPHSRVPPSGAGERELSWAGKSTEVWAGDEKAPGAA